MAVWWICDDRKIESLRIGCRKPCSTIQVPLHGGSNTVSVSEINIITHPDFVAVIQYRRSWQRKQYCMKKFSFATVVVHQRSWSPANAHVKLIVGILRVGFEQIVLLFLCHQFQTKLIMVS